MTRNDDSVLSRRAALKLVGAATTAGGIATAGLTFLTTPAVAATTTLTASDISFTSNAGQLKSLYVQPVMDYEWNGLEAAPERIDFYVETRLPNVSGAGTYEQVGSEGETISSSALESSSTNSYSFQNTVSILAHSSIDDKDFEKTGDDWTKDTTVDVRVRTELEDTSGNIYTDTPEASFTVTLTDEQGSTNSGGNANPGGTAK